jgi:hypothetical protein
MVDAATGVCKDLEDEELPPFPRLSRLIFRVRESTGMRCTVPAASMTLRIMAAVHSMASRCNTTAAVTRASRVSVEPDSRPRAANTCLPRAISDRDRTRWYTSRMWLKGASISKLMYISTRSWWCSAEGGGQVRTTQ